MTPDDCGTINPLLSLYADGMASAEEAQRLETHLPGCAACREALAWMQATQRALAARPVMSPPAALRARIAEAIAASAAAPVPARAARAFVLRPALAAAASLTALGIVVSYGLLHHPSEVAVHPTVKQPMVAVVSPTNSASPVIKPPTMTGPGIKPPVAHRPSPAVRPARTNPALMARVQPDEAQPEATEVKMPTEASSRIKRAETSAPVIAPLRPHLSLVKKTVLPHFKPEMMAINKHLVSPVETHRAKVVQPEPRKPETIVAVAPHASTPSTPTFVEKPPVITPDPAPTVVVVSSHESHFQTADFLGPVREHLGRMRSVAYTTQRKSIKGTILAVSTMDQSKTPGVDTVRGSF